jgi:hypothetical protein
VEVDPSWYDGFFDDFWLTVLEGRSTPERSMLEADFVVEALGLEPGAAPLGPRVRDRTS